MKSCCIYKTKKHFKIVTMYLTDTGSYVLRGPVHILDLNVSVEELREKIFDSLNASREIPHPENSFFKELIKKMKEPSFKSLYQNSTSCNLFLENNILTIEPNRCKDPNEGLEVVVEDIQKIEYYTYNEIEITKTIMEILDRKY